MEGVDVSSYNSDFISFSFAILSVFASYILTLYYQVEAC